MTRGWTVAILGATGAVGRTMLSCLEASSIGVRDLRLLATPRSEGSTLPFRGKQHSTRAVSPEHFVGVDLALFSAGARASGDWAPVATAAGAWVVDNSSRFRMEPDVPLVVPEVNAEAIPSAPCLIANPNCSTIQMVVALAPIHRRWVLTRVGVATYQAVSGTGERGVLALAHELERWRKHRAELGTRARLDGSADTDGEGSPDALGAEPPGSADVARSRGALGAELHGFVFGPTDEAPVEGSPYPHPVLGNSLPQCDVFLEDGYTREEEKMIDETRKILGLPNLIVQPSCVRVPVVTGHSESIYVETERHASPVEVRELLSASPGVSLFDDPANAGYPHARMAAGTDRVWVGRIRQDRGVENGLHLWVVADNLRKGAALNAVQIAEIIWERGGK